MSSFGGPWGMAPRQSVLCLKNRNVFTFVNETRKFREWLEVDIWNSLPFMPLTSQNVYLSVFHTDTWTRSPSISQQVLWREWPRTRNGWELLRILSHLEELNCYCFSYRVIFTRLKPSKSGRDWNHLSQVRKHIWTLKLNIFGYHIWRAL